MARSRPDRWFEAATQAQQAVNDLLEIQAEYQEWYDNLPEGLEDEPTGERLDAVCSIRLGDAKEIVDATVAVTLPKGFGRDDE